MPILANDFPGDNKTKFYKLFKSWNEVLPTVAKDLTDLFMESYQKMTYGFFRQKCREKE